MIIFLQTYLGWSNEDTHGGESLRLYALDKGQSPRWAPNGGRTVERALLEHNGGNRGEGDRYLVVRLGDRFTDMEFVARVISSVERVMQQDAEVIEQIKEKINTQEGFGYEGRTISSSEGGD